MIEGYEELSTNEKLKLKYARIRRGNRFGWYFKKGEWNGLTAGIMLGLTPFFGLMRWWPGIPALCVIAAYVWISGHRWIIRVIEGEVERSV